MRKLQVNTWDMFWNIMVLQEIEKKWNMIQAIWNQLSNIFSEGELIEEQVCRKFRQSASDWGVYDTNFYNLRIITDTFFTAILNDK